MKELLNTLHLSGLAVGFIHRSKKIEPPRTLKKQNIILNETTEEIAFILIFATVLFKNFTAAILFDLRSPRVLCDASHATNNRTNTTGVITFIVSNGELPLVHLITEGHVPVREQRIDSWHINTSSVRHPPLPRVLIVKLDFPHDWNIKPVAHYNH